VDTREYEDGSYKIYARAYDGKDYSEIASIELIFDNEVENHAPKIEIIEPDGSGDSADESYIIEWEASDQDGDELTISLYYDTDTDPDNGKTEIVSGLSNTGSYSWDTREVEEGDYYIYGIADDHNGSQAWDYSDGRVSITHEGGGGEPENHPPEIEISLVEKLDNWTVRIWWNATDQDYDYLKVSLYYIPTIEQKEENAVLIEKDLSNTGSYDFELSGLTEGEYIIFAKVEDGKGGIGKDFSEPFTVFFPEILPDFALVQIEVEPEKVKSGELVEITVSVKNLGEIGGFCFVLIYLDSELLLKKNLALSPQEMKEVSTIWFASGEGMRVVKAKVEAQQDKESENNEIVKTLEMEPPSPPKEKEEESWNIWIPTSLIVIVVASLLFSFVYYKKKRTPLNPQENTENLVCPLCGNQSQYVAEYDDYYCWECEKYIGEDL
ncbi:MAG TPA: hypothetical protein EYP29_00955, partial [Thermoplasmata archaeon]|nr:hypothetical protein [Thermoplasmata archaeon]